MKNVKTQILIMLIIGFVGFGIMFYELVKVFTGVVNNEGVRFVPLDGVIQHKVGELMIFVSFFSILLFSKIWTKERVFALADKIKFVMLIGGILNGLAWLTVSDKLAWSHSFRLWCLFLLIFGQIAAPIAKWLAGKDIRKNLSSETRTD